MMRIFLTVLILAFQSFILIAQQIDSLNEVTNILPEEEHVLKSEFEKVKKEADSVNVIIVKFDKALTQSKQQIIHLNNMIDSLNLLINSLNDTYSEQLSITSSNLKKLDQALLNKTVKIDSIESITDYMFKLAILKIDSTNNRISNFENETNSTFLTLNSNYSTYSLWGLLGLVTVLLISVGGWVFLKGLLYRQKSDTNNSLLKSNKLFESKIIEIELANKTHTKLLDILHQKIQSIKFENTELDHSLALASALEITRMRKRINLLESDEKSIKSLEKALIRLENELGLKGYEIIDLEGTKYDDGMNMIVDFITDDNLKENEAIITRVLTPQVNFKGNLIQQAKVQVSISN